MALPIDQLLRIPPDASAWSGVGGPTSAPDWDAWETQGNLAPPGADGNGYVPPDAMPGARQAAVDPTPGRSALQAVLPALFAQNQSEASANTLAPTPAPAPAPAAAPAATPDWSGALPTPPVPPAGGPPLTPPTAADRASMQQASSADAFSPRDYGPVTQRILSMNQPNSQNGAGSTAGGQGDFTDSTWGDFLKSPANTGNWTMADKRGNLDAATAATNWYAHTNDALFQQELGRPATNPELLASHMLGGQGVISLEKGDPNGDAYSTLKPVMGNLTDAAFSQNGKLLTKGMTNQQALASVTGYMSNGTIGGGPMLASTQTQGQPATGPQQQTQSSPGQFDLAQFLKEIGPELPYSPQQLAMPKGSQLLALAGGLLSGRSFAQGLGQGLTNMNQVQLADIANKRAINGQIMQLAQLGMLSNYRNTMAGVAQQNAASHALTAGTGLQRMLNTTTPGGKAALSNANQQGKDNADANDEIGQAYEDANVKIPQIEALQQTIRSGNVATGPGLNEIKRQLSNYFNVYLGSDPTQTQISAAQAAQIRGTDAFAKNMRNVREFNSLMEGLSNVDLQNPQALLKLTNGLRNIQNLKLQMFNDWKGLGPQGRSQLLNDPNGGMSIWQADEANKWRQGLGQGGFYGDGSTTLVPTASSPTQQASAGPVGGTTSTGVKWSLQ